MSDTPRTDEVELSRHEIADHGHGDGTFVESSFARQLERELAAAQAKVLVYDPDSAWHDWRVKNPDNTMYEAFKAGYYAAIKEKP